MNQQGEAANRDIGLVPLADPADGSIAGAIRQDEYDLDCPWHHHKMHQLQYVFEGAIELEDAHGRHLLPRGLAGWIPGGTRHRNSLHHIRSLSIVLAPALVPEPGTGIRIVSVPPLMREMIAEAVRWPLGAPLDETGVLFLTAFGRLCRGWIGDRAPLTLPTSADPALAAALARVRADPAGCTMAASARSGGLSERTLRRRCAGLSAYAGRITAAASG